MLILSSADFFFFKIFEGLSECVNQDQDQHSVVPDLGPNCLRQQKLPLADKEKSFEIIQNVLTIEILVPLD